MWVVGLPAFFPGNDLVPLLTSSVGLLVLLLYFPGGLIQIAYSARDALLDCARAAARASCRPSSSRPLPASLRPARARPAARSATPALRADDVTVQFGGIHAVDGVSISVGAGEIVGLIGTNGAGKSHADERHRRLRARRAAPSTSSASRSSSLCRRRPGPAKGLGRTFQAATLFPELTVRETVQLALGGPAPHRLSCRPRSACRRRCAWSASGAPRPTSSSTSSASAATPTGYISDLSTGTRRIVELAGLLALDARVLCLDEPTAGLAQRETEAFGPLIIEIRGSWARRCSSSSTTCR